MSIRRKANEWFQRKYGKVTEPVYTSKYYLPEESWPKKSVWWLHIPLSVIDRVSYINILCEKLPNSEDFYYLKVPSKFLLTHQEKFHYVNNKISLYLSTESKSLFIELRGKGNLDFSKFLV